MRLWIGLVHEAWEMFRRQFQEKRELSSTYLPLLSHEGVAAKEELNRYFGRSGEIAGVRNRYAFHAPPGDEMNDAFAALPDTDAWKVYTAGTDGNMFFITAEVLSSYAIDRNLRGTSGLQGLPELLATTNAVSVKLLHLLNEVQVRILLRHYPDAATTRAPAFDVTAPPRARDVRLPFYIDEFDRMP